MDWTRMPDRELLQMRICDLELSLESTWLYECVCQVWEELAIRGLRFRPHAWLSDEWYCPDGIPGIAIPIMVLSINLVGQGLNDSLNPRLRNN